MLWPKPTRLDGAWEMMGLLLVHVLLVDAVHELRYHLFLGISATFTGPCPAQRAAEELNLWVVLSGLVEVRSNLAVLDDPERICSYSSGSLFLLCPTSLFQLPQPLELSLCSHDL